MRWIERPRTPHGLARLGRSDEETFGCWFEALEVGDYGTVACGHVFETEATLLVGYLAAGFSTAHINVSVTPGTITG